MKQIPYWCKGDPEEGGRHLWFLDVEEGSQAEADTFGTDYQEVQCPDHAG